jgi:hypothetical protein
MPELPRRWTPGRLEYGVQMIERFAALRADQVKLFEQVVRNAQPLAEAGELGLAPLQLAYRRLGSAITA